MKRTNPKPLAFFFSGGRTSPCCSSNSGSGVSSETDNSSASGRQPSLSSNSDSEGSSGTDEFSSSGEMSSLFSGLYGSLFSCIELIWRMDPDYLEGHVYLKSRNILLNG